MAPVGCREYKNQGSSHGHRARVLPLLPVKTVQLTHALAGHNYHHLEHYEKHCSQRRDVEAVRSEAAEGKHHVRLLRRPELRQTVNAAC